MASENFYRIWEPRIGRDAANILKTRAWLAVLPFGFIVTTVVFALTLNDATYYIADGAVLVTGFGVMSYALPRINRRLAAAMSNHLGMNVTSLPRFRSADRFDTWLANERAGKPRRERSFLGGFIRISLPPK